MLVVGGFAPQSRGFQPTGNGLGLNRTLIDCYTRGSPASPGWKGFGLALSAGRCRRSRNDTTADTRHRTPHPHHTHTHTHTHTRTLRVQLRRSSHFAVAIGDQCIPIRVGTHPREPPRSSRCMLGSPLIHAWYSPHACVVLIIVSLPVRALSPFRSARSRFTGQVSWDRLTALARSCRRRASSVRWQA